MKTRLRILALAVLPLSTWAQVPQLRETVAPVPSSNVVKPTPLSTDLSSKVAAACAVSTNLDFAQRPDNESWKNRPAIIVGAAPRNTTIETAGTYIEPAGGAETTLSVEANTTNNLGVPNLYWFTNYTSRNNSTTQITYSFNRPVNGFSLTLLDVDRNNTNFIDAVTLDAFQADGNLLDVSANNDATVANNTAFTSVSGNTVTGIQQNPDGQSSGTVTVTFNKPITRFVITYRNTFNIADPGVQYIGIASMNWCTQANVATTLMGPARALPGAQVTYTARTTANGDYTASGVQPVVQLSPGLNSQSPSFPAGSSYDNTTGLLTLAAIPTLAVGATSTASITFRMPASTVTGKASSTIDTDDSDSSDNNGSLANANVTTTVNQAPTAQAKSATVSNNRAIYTAIPALTGTDPDNDPLTYVIENAPAAGFGTIYYLNGTTRTAIGGGETLTAAQVATLEFQRGSFSGTLSGSFFYHVSDPYGGVSPSVNYALSVADQPAVYSSPNYSIREGTGRRDEVIATPTDPDGSITGATLTSASDRLPTNLELNANGSFSRDRERDIAVGTYNFVVRTTGPGGITTSVPVTIIITNGTDAAATYSTNNRFNRDALANGNTLATVTDPDAPLTAATVPVNTLPTGMSLDGTSGRITVGTTAPFAGTYTYNVSTTDAAGGTSTPAVTITVFDDTEAIYSLATAPAPANAYNNNDVLATVSDADGAVNTASAVSGAAALPSGVGLNATTGQFFVANRQLLRSGTYPVQVRTTDATGGITVQTVNIFIKQSPLPVELKAFEVAANNASANLTWSTASEKNNDHFDVERSFDGRTFERIGQVQGRGTTSQTTTYSFTDTNIGTKRVGVVYYRLQQVDTDGTASYSPVRTASFAAGLMSGVAAVGVYPNPATSQNLTVTLALATLPIGTYEVNVLDATGRVVRTQSVQGGQEQTLNVQQLPTGMYLVQVRGNALNLTQRFSKQ